MLANIVRWSLERPRLIAWACVWFLALGLFYVRDVRFDFTPNLAPAETTIQTEAPGLVAEQVEDVVTRPIESVLVGAAGVAQVHSESVQGLSMITVRFAEGTDSYRARQAVSESLTALAGTLPASASPPRIAPLTSQGAQVMQIGFTSAQLDPMALRDLVQWTVRPRLQAVAGVARVSVYGGRTRRIEVRARPGDLSDSDLGFLDILNATRRATSVAGAGFIDTPTQRVSIAPHGQALTSEDVAAGQIQTPGSAPVRIGDVSDVVEAPAPGFGDALILGKPGVILTVARQYGANTLETTHGVEAALAELRPTLLAQGVSVDTHLDRPATFTVAAMTGLAYDLAIGAALIAVVLALFLREPRAVLNTLASIPLSLLAAVMALKAFGLTLNAMTLGGLILSLGIVFDDAVIGVDNVAERLREAEHGHAYASDRDTVLAATLEVRGPITYAIFALIAALAPLLALPGQQGALLAPLAVAVIAASLASLIVATVVTPALCMLFHRHQEPLPDPAGLTRLKEAQGRLLQRLCARPAPILLGAGILATLALVALTLYHSEFLPPVHDGHLVAEVKAPPATALEAMTDYGVRVSGALLRIPGVTAVSQRIGRDVTDAESRGPEHAVFDIDLRPGLNAAAQDEIARRVQDALAFHPGFAATVASRFDAVQNSLGAIAPVQINLYGQDVDALDAAAGRIGKTLKALPGARSVQVESAARAPAVRVDLNFPRLALYGLSAGDVMDTVQAAFAGERVAQIYNGGRVVEVAVSAQDRLRRDPEGVGSLLLRSTSGISVPLKDVANVYLSDGRAMIAHDGGFRRQVITADPADPSGFVRQARKAIADHVVLPSGAFLGYGGAAQAVADAQRDLLISYALAGFAIVGLLSIAFDGRIAVLILGSSLLAFVGGAAAVALLLGGVLTVGAIVGFIALFGLSMRSAILLCDRLEHLVLERRAGWSLATVVLAARQRLTPILMTALLAALALAPLALDAGRSGREILGPMAIVILGGLVTGALANLIVLPVMLSAFWRPGYSRRVRRDGGHGHAREHG
jgi:CzcA family heavy metal efflux pump